MEEGSGRGEHMRPTDKCVSKNIIELLWAHGLSLGDYENKVGVSGKTIMKKGDLIKARYLLDGEDLETEGLCEHLYGTYRLPENLSYLLERDRMYKTKLGAIVGATAETVRRWASGRTRPAPFHVRELSKHFKISPLQLQYGIPENDFKTRRIP
jgi:hypothetical protein